MSDRLIIAPAWEKTIRDAWLDSVDAVFAHGKGDVVTVKTSSEVRRFELPHGGHRETVFVKKYWVSDPSQLASALFRDTLSGRSRVKREFENLQRLREWGLDAPEPIAFGEQRVCGFLTRSFLISRAVESPIALDGIIRNRPSAAQRRELIERLADATRRMHDRNFVHGDYYWRNIILRNGALDRFYLLDAHKGRLFGAGESLARRAEDLAMLDAPAPKYFRRAERMKFFLRYVGRKKLSADDKTLIRMTLRLAKPMRARQIHRVERTLV